MNYIKLHFLILIKDLKCNFFYNFLKIIIKFEKFLKNICQFKKKVVNFIYKLKKTGGYKK